MCAVIPAAGRGSRLGADLPKLLVAVDEIDTIWSVLHRKLAPLVDHIQVVLSPGGVAPFLEHVGSLPPQVSVVVQDEPRGMGDAIFRGRETWRRFDDILVVWGDQVHVSHGTLVDVLGQQAGRRRCVIPVVSVVDPYVQYMFEGEGRLVHIRQTREGDAVDAVGLGDVGTFLLATSDLEEAWERYLERLPLGRQTGEVNFLPFLVHLSTREGWEVLPVRVDDPDEARGINTPEDLAFFREKYAGRK